MDTQLSANLKLSQVTISETAKRRRINNNPTPEHLENLKYLAEKIYEPLFSHFKTPLRMNSVYRSKALNRAIGGSSNSFHSSGCAIDFDMDGTSITNKQIFDYIKDNLDFTELINEFNFSWIHVAIVKGREKEKEVLEAKKIKNKTVYLKI
jgi:zinc D-Ala-D-Ala carboxypeptidase